MVEKKEKPKIPKQKMPEQDPKVRAKNFKEVPFRLLTRTGPIGGEPLSPV